MCAEDVLSLPQTGADVLAGVCALLAQGDVTAAAAAIRADYPFRPLTNAGRRYSPAQCAVVFVRDGFVCRYTGRKLVFPGTLRLIARLMPEDFPFHPNWKTDRCHIAFWELFPTIDHVVPVSRGGPDDESNWVSTSMLRNAAKANFLLDELGWTLLPVGSMAEWDGLAGWFAAQVRAQPGLMADPYLRSWYKAVAPLLGADEASAQAGRYES